MTRRFTPQLLFTLAAGLLGWGVLAALALGSSLAIGYEQPTVFLGFLGVTLAGRAMAFRIGTSLLSLDSAFYVAAAVVMGPLSAGLMVAVALTIDAIARCWLAERRTPRSQGGRGADRRDRVAYALYFGGMTGAVIALIAWALAPLAALAIGAELRICVRVAAIGLALLVAHNLIQGLRQRLDGRPLGRFLIEVAGPSIVAEVTLLPLASVLALLHATERRIGFVLLCATYLLVNLIFNRLARASRGWRARIGELELLDHAARELARSIELPHVVATVARQAVAAIPAAESVALIHRGAERETERFVVDAYDRERDRFARMSVGRGDGLTGRVVQTLAPVSIADLADCDVDVGPGGTEGVRSWLGVPIFVQGACEGVLAVQSRTAGAFDAADQRRLASLALQAGAALQNAHLYAMAMVDGLTGLFVRRYFDARVEEEIERARRYGHPFALVMIDIDDFKRLNDTHGHLVGDRVLREVAAVVKAEMRGVDTASRYGGEELVVILPRTELVAALTLAERIRAKLAARRIAAGPEGPVLMVTASFGIAAYPESGTGDAEDLVRRADRALYRAKRTGKNRVELYWADDSGATRASA